MFTRSPVISAIGVHGSFQLIPGRQGLGPLSTQIRWDAWSLLGRYGVTLTSVTGAVVIRKICENYVKIM